MICPQCDGEGLIVRPGESPAPCPECGGSGRAHCCEGLVCQPDSDPPECQP
jgi:hypothetical protein